MIGADDISLLTAGFRRALAAEDPDAVDKALDEVGWREALAEEGATVMPIVFTEKGLAGASATVIDDLLLMTLGLEPGADAGVVQPEPGRRTPPGRISGGRLSVAGTATARLLRGATAVVAATSDGGAEQVVTAQAADLTIRPVAGIDLAFGLVTVTADAIAFETAGAATAPWSLATAVAQLALGFELLGASRAMLALAREHALARTQFGRPIASFQAVRHRLADALVAVEGTAAAVSAAWEAGDWTTGGDRGQDQLAAIAKAVAGRNARTVARHCQQVLAGIGFTAEHRFHRYFRRVLLLDELFGSSRELTHDLGRELLVTRQLPAPIPL
jgi:hypothetical protein